jgi:hypothetical protein
MDLSEDERIALATEAHDKVCACDRKYLRSCPHFAAAILGTVK